MSQAGVGRGIALDGSELDVVPHIAAVTTAEGNESRVSRGHGVMAVHG